MNGSEARAFASGWITAWNAHDLDRVIALYAPDAELLSPIPLRLMGSGRLVGAAALRAYWEAALKDMPDIKFELLGVLTGHDCLTIRYKNQRKQEVVETFEFGKDGKIVRSFACHA